ncbi:MAG TPA: protein-disulfide reductase DsbD N-terminal domain-containing protein, partial [Burkholderiales bacterium]|nr:protein-disulfide reductase DsbD N-terminal domain-containing protein [Burkholderiales bacterium]
MRIFYKYLFLLNFLCYSQIILAAQPDLLEPEKAFQFSARVLDTSNIEVRYQIADGYYLYRERFAFAAEPENVKLGAAQIPQGKKKKDEFFGEVQTHRGELRIIVPVSEAGDGKIALTATSQGCADVGVCYVPMESKIQLAMAGGAAAATGDVTGTREGNDPLARILGQPAPTAQLTADTAEDLRIAGLFHGSFW